MKIRFVKYSATGNDFILFDNRDMNLERPISKLFDLCKNHNLLRADGIIMLEKSNKAAFKMRYFNKDETEASMCGNGARSVFKFASELGISGNVFETNNGLYEGEFSEEGVNLKMQSPKEIGKYKKDITNYSKNIYINTGVPHIVLLTDNLEKEEVIKVGQKIRYDKTFPYGVNVNFMQRFSDKEISIRTYERGVEDETLSCGTGAMASAYAAYKWFNASEYILINVLGGKLKVCFDENFQSVYLCGKVEKITDGEIDY